jgi:hypothetical protein
MSLQRLYEIADCITEPRGSIESITAICAAYRAADATYLSALKRGGFHARDCSLRLFGVSGNEDTKDVGHWNDQGTWKYAYKDLVQDMWCFAEDVFGNQFVFANNGVCWFQNETAELLPICDTFEEWAEEMLRDFNYYSGASVAKGWNEQQLEEPLTPLYHLGRIMPFVCEGEFSLENVFRYPVVKNMTFWANFALRIKDLPEGTKIQFKFVDH